MNRTRFDTYIRDHYGITADYPWENDFVTAVYRHPDNRKWFALVMRLPAEKFDRGEGMLDVVNLKCDPLLIGSLRKENGIFPAYHMNKANWITVALDNAVSEDTVYWLLKISFDLTRKKQNKRK